MSWNQQDESTHWKVVLNHEEQYSIWPVDRENAPGWTDAGKSGTRTECLAHIEEVWTDMRPLSLRKRMEEAAQRGAAAAPEETLPEDPSYPERPTADRLVNFLSAKDHRVEVALRPERTVEVLRACFERDYVHVRFPDTNGGTELGVAIDRAASQLDTGAGLVRIEGTLTLNDIPVRCVAQVELATMAGTGRLLVMTANQR